MKPTIGRIVHYTNLGDRDGKYPPQVQAAIVTRVHNATHVALHIFYPTGQFDMEDVEMSEQPAGIEASRGKWSWPERV